MSSALSPTSPWLSNFLSTFADLSTHPCPSCDPTLDLVDAPMDEANAVPSITTFLHHTPLLYAAMMGNLKMSAVFVVCVLITLLLMSLILPSKTTPIRHRRSILLVLLLTFLVVIYTDEMYQMEYNFNIPEPSSNLYDYSSYSDDVPCRNGHTEAGIYHGDTDFAKHVGRGERKSGDVDAFLTTSANKNNIYFLHFASLVSPFALPSLRYPPLPIHLCPLW